MVRRVPRATASPRLCTSPSSWARTASRSSA